MRADDNCAEVCDLGTQYTNQAGNIINMATDYSPITSSEFVNCHQQILTGDDVKSAENEVATMSTDGNTAVDIEYKDYQPHEIGAEAEAFCNAQGGNPTVTIQFSDYDIKEEVGNVVIREIENSCNEIVKVEPDQIDQIIDVPTDVTRVVPRSDILSGNVPAPGLNAISMAMESPNNSGVAFEITTYQLDQTAVESITLGDSCNTRVTELSNGIQRKKKHHSLKDTMPATCPVCNKLFTQRKNIYTHMKIHSRQNTHRCETCGQAFPFKTHMFKHMKEAHRVLPHKCDVCGKMFACLAKLTTHHKVHEPKEDRRLRKAHHMKQDTNPECRFCSKVCRNSKELKDHMKVHRQAHRCDICLMTFVHFETLQRHITSTHSNLRPYRCELCSKCFKKKQVLTVHMLTHTGQKEYKCNICSKTFVQGSQLKVHKRIHTGEKPYRCPMCDMSFAQIGTREAHLRVHTGERPYKCDQCDAKFRQNAHLLKHLKGHEGKATYSCDICGGAFATSYCLQKHNAFHKNHKKAK